MRHLLRAAGFATAVALVARPAAGQTSLDMVEHMLGASNVNAVAGHGGLTAGVSADGDLTVLAWPGPGYYDHLAYVASNALDVRSEPHMGALDGMGSYLGLVVTTAAGPSLTWLRDAAWQHTQAYAAPDAPVPVTTFARTDLGITVTLTDVVSPDVDVLTRHLTVQLAAGSPVTAASLVVYENLSPTLSRIPELAITDWAFDSRNDFLAAYDATTQAIVHFHPASQGVMHGIGDLFLEPTSFSFGAVNALMQSASPSDAAVDAFLAGLDASYGPGVAALVTTEPPPASYQVGSDATSICGQMDSLADNLLALPSEFPGYSFVVDPTSFADGLRCTDTLSAVRAANGWVWAPEDALADLADLALSGSRVAAGQTNGALVAPLTFSGGSAEGSAVFAFGSTFAAAKAALAAGTQQPFASRLAASEGAAHAALAGAALPDPSLGPGVVEVAERALVNVYVARDRGVGAIAASVGRQAPYYPDWPRDGAFISAALDVAGLHGWVTQRHEWYVGLQRTQPTTGIALLTPEVTTDPDTGQQIFPAFAWEMNYFTDGPPGGAIRFEIDNTALHVWSIVSHAANLSGEGRASFIAAVWPSTRDALDLLERWRDPKTGLQAPANEDDDYALTSTLHGAAAVYPALVAGARLAHAAGDDTRAQAYLARAAELQGAILRSYYDPETGLFRDVQGGPSGAQGGDTGWLAWPGRVLAPGDARLEGQLEADMTHVLAILHGQGEGGTYLGKNVLAAALAGDEDGARKQAREAVALLAGVATADTHHFGEVYLSSPGPGGTIAWSNRVDTPHVWEGVLFYLSAMALTDPSGFDLEDEALPLPSSAPPPEAGGGCGCRVARAPDGALPLVLALPLAALAARRVTRRRRKETAR